MKLMVEIDIFLNFFLKKLLGNFGECDSCICPRAVQLDILDFSRADYELETT